MYRDLFRRNGRTDAECDHFLTNVFTGAIRSSANTGTMTAVTAPLIARHPEWAEYIAAFHADRDFIRNVQGVVPGMKETLRDIAAKGHEIYGLTNWASDTFETLRTHYPAVTGLFNNIVVSGTVGLKKPNPEIFQLAQQAFGDPTPDRVYYFDDKPANIAAAHEAVGWNGVVFADKATVRSTLGL